MQDLDEISSKKLLNNVLAEIVKKHRQALKKSIYAVSAECSLAKNTWRDVELQICKDPAFSTIWKIAEGLDMYPDELIKEVREKLGDKFSLSGLE